MYSAIVRSVLNPPMPAMLRSARSAQAAGSRYSASTWAERALRNIAGMGDFSTDRTIAEYIEHVWTDPKSR